MNNTQLKATVSSMKKQKQTFLQIFGLPQMPDNEFSLLVDQAADNAIAADETGEIDLFLHLSKILMNFKNAIYD